MLEFINISKNYDYVAALNNVSFKINKGEIVGLIGANGAGKTTTIKLATKYITADSGNIFLNDVNLENVTNEKFPISYIPDEPIFYDFMTVAEHFKFIESLYTNGVYKSTNLIKRFSLEEYTKKMPHTLSKGNRQKLMISMALLREFDLLIADEPFTGLDPKQINMLKDTFIELKSMGKGVLLSTHLLDMIELFCDRYIMIEKGKIICVGTKEDIAKNMNLDIELSIEEMYLKITNDRNEE